MKSTTYRAAVEIAPAVGIVVLPVLVGARVADTVARESDNEIKLRVWVGWLILHEASVGHVRDDVVERRSDVDRSAVACVALATTPSASLRLCDTLIVDVILGRCRLVVPEVVRLLIRICKLFGLSRIDGKGKSLALSSYDWSVEVFRADVKRTWIICPAKRDWLGKLALDHDLDMVRTSTAQSLCERAIGHLQHAVAGAVESTDRLFLCALHLREGHLEIGVRTSV